jgi:hypothetical protein
LRTRWNHRGTREAGELVSYVELSNSLWEAGYWTTAEFIKDMVEDRYGPLPYLRKSETYTDPSTGQFKLSRSPLIGFYRSHVNHTRANRSRMKHRRFSPRLHLLEYRTWVIKPIFKQYSADGWKECLRVINTGSKGSNTGLYALPRRVCLRRGWAAA